MIRKWTLLSLIIMSLISSCSNDEELDSDIDKPSEYQEIPIKFDPDQVIPVDHLIDKIQQIRLQDNPENLLSEVFKVSYTKDKKVFVVDRLSNIIYVYMDNGKLLAKINRNGNGVGEYKIITDMQVDRNSNVIGIVDGLQMKFIKLDLSGNLIKEYSLSSFIGVSKFSFLLNGDIIFSKGIPPGKSDKRYSLIVTDSNVNFKNNLYYYQDASSAVFSALFPLQRLGSEALFLPIYSDKIYQVTSNSIKQKYKLSFGERWLPKEYAFTRLHTTTYQWMLSELPKSNYVYFVNFNETNDHLIIYFTYKGKNYMTVYDKSSKKMLTTLLNDEYRRLGFSSASSYTIADKFHVTNISNIDNLENSEVRKTLNLKEGEKQINPIILLNTFKKL